MPIGLSSQAEGHAVADRQQAAELAVLTTRQRGERVMAACRSASLIYRSRLVAGLPIEQPAPWPASTWEFLKAKASHVRQTSQWDEVVRDVQETSS